MKKKIFLTAVILTLIATGCAQKKLNTTTNNNSGVTTPGVEDGTEVYQNVDPYGSGNGQYSVANGTDSYGIAATGIQNIYFDTDQYDITPDKLGIISQDATILKSKLKSGGKVKIEGHCDATGTDEYNYALGLRRAKATKDALQSNGINPRNIILVSMGESSPACTTSISAACYAKNRRVEFKILK